MTLSLAGTACIAACAWWPRQAVVPMPVIRQPANTERRASMLVVMLPGAYSRPRDFVDRGFVAAIQAQGFEVDALLADAHLGYAENGTLLERLHDDVLVPAQREGYRRIWLVGISLGGLASLGLLMRHPEMLEGIVTIAPYVGPPALVQQVAAAGGARAYADAVHADGDLEAALWSWLGHSSPAVREKIYLYAGSQDRLIGGQRLLAALLATDHTLELPGNHDWPVWIALWSRWLVRAPWPRTTSAAQR